MSDWRILKIFSDTVLKFVFARVGFWSGRMYDIAGIGSAHFSNLTVNDDPSKWVVIVGRAYYFETVRDYPVGRLRDLKEILKNEPWSFPYTGLLQQKIERLSDQSHRVTSWVVKQEVLDKLTRRPLWVIPESACLMKLAKSTIVDLNRLDESVYICVTAGGLISSVGQVQSFYLNAGVMPVAGDSPQVGKVTLSNSQASEALGLGVWDNLKVSPVAFFSGFNRSSLASYSWRVPLEIFSSVALTYLIMSSLYLLMVDAWVDSELVDRRGEAEESAAVRRDISIYQEKANEMSSILLEAQPLWVAWDIMLDMVGIGIVVRAVNSKSPEVIFYLTADRATDVLQWLSDDPRIASTEVTLPVRKALEGEQFAVSVTFNNVAKDSLTSNLRLPANEPISSNLLETKIAQ